MSYCKCCAYNDSYKFMELYKLHAVKVLRMLLELERQESLSMLRLDRL